MPLYEYIFFIVNLLIVLFDCKNFVLTQDIPKLPITIYYESLCPDSIRFIREQFYPTWKELAPYLDITFIPFGKSSSINGGESFQCQHGPKECVGNKLQSCALNQLNGRNDLQIEFVHCFMSPGPKAKDCASLVGADWEAVKECYNSNFGTELQLQAEIYTKKIQPKFIPTIIFNGVFDQFLQDTAQDNFKGVVCSYLKQFNPNICK